MPRRRLIVAGATGRIGHILWQAWNTSPPSAFDVTWTGRRAAGPVGAAQVACRLEQPDAFAALLRPADLVLDLAGPTRPVGNRGFEDHARLFEALLALSHCPVITMSSSAVYGSGLNRTETMPPAPQNDYGRAKVAVEALVAKSNRATALRLGNVAGADALLGGATSGQTVSLDQFEGGTTPRRSYLGPFGLAQIMVQLCEQAESLPDILNLCGTHDTEMADLLDEAGMEWTGRAAPETAVKALTLSPDLLSEHVDLPPLSGTAADVIADWRGARQ